MIQASDRAAWIAAVLLAATIAVLILVPLVIDYAFL
jgi:hypothetical protein